MRKTVSIDDDVATQLARLQQARGVTFEAVLNETLRAALSVEAKSDPAEHQERFVTPTVNLGECRLPNLDNVEEILSIVEGEFRK